MQILKQDWWATPIWHFDIPATEINPVDVEQECYQHKKTDLGNVLSNVGGYQSNSIYDVDTYPAITKLLTTIQRHSHVWFDELGVKKMYPRLVDNFWININSANHYNKAHVHQRSIFSGVYYVKSNPNSGRIEFNNQSDRDFILQTFTDQNKYTVSELNYDAIVGRVVVFPSWIQHSVSPNLSTQDRISIAFNMT